MLQLNDLTPSAKRVYDYLSRVADDEGYAYPFHRTYAQRTNLAESTVVRALKELKDRSLVTHRRHVSRRGQSSNLYQVHGLGGQHLRLRRRWRPSDAARRPMWVISDRAVPTSNAITPVMVCTTPGTLYVGRTRGATEVVVHSGGALGDPNL